MLCIAGLCDKQYKNPYKNNRFDISDSCDSDFVFALCLCQSLYSLVSELYSDSLFHYLIDLCPCANLIRKNKNVLDNSKFTKLIVVGSL